MFVFVLSGTGYFETSRLPTGDLHVGGIVLQIYLESAGKLTSILATSLVKSARDIISHKKTPGSARGRICSPNLLFFCK